ncbi:MAG: hypothetical protein A4E60_03520 [Syntrophorhabdus sp. PtaB.Bin047]|nr:MAG: hypothetical protein A4E60_03520 [Syntrophorhabdus sp. PtaB.Bin047]
MKIIRIESCGTCIHLNDQTNYCYEMQEYTDNLDIIHPDCPLEDEKE